MVRTRVTPRHPTSKQPAPKRQPAKKADKEKKENENVYDVEMIVDQRVKDDASDDVEYYVKWRGFPSTSNTWEPKTNIFCQKLIKDFESRQAERRPSPRKSTADIDMADDADIDDESGPAESDDDLDLSPKKRKAKDRTSKPGKRPNNRETFVISNLGPSPKTLKRTPIRGNLKFSPSPSPQPPDEASKTTKVTKASRSKKAAPVIPKRKSLSGLVAKTVARGSRKAPLRAAKNTPKKVRKSEEKELHTESEKVEVCMSSNSSDITAIDSNYGAGSEDTQKYIPMYKIDEKSEAPSTTTKGSSKTTATASASKRTPERTSNRKITAKRAKRTLMPELEESEADNPKEAIDFHKVKLTRVINDSSSSKTITLQGVYLDKPLVIQLEKTIYDEAIIKKALLDKATTSNHSFSNDVYSSYIINPATSASSLNDIRATVVWPASPAVLEKYSRSETIFFCETPEIYSRVVQPYIENKVTNEKDYNQWVFNILDGKSEADRVILNDPDLNSGFMLVNNLNWAGDQKDLNLLAICNRRDIFSLRDLNQSHLTMLKNILTKATKAIKDKFKKTKGQLRAYVHYHPSFYHFHVHFRMVDPSDYVATDRDNLLSTIINNITLFGDYYSKSTLTYPLTVSSSLYQELKKAKRL